MNNIVIIVELIELKFILGICIVFIENKNCCEKIKLIWKFELLNLVK